jgi:hypothetical protein
LQAGGAVISFVVGLFAVLLLAPLGMSAVRWAKRQRGGAVVLTGLMLMFGMNIQITPPPPPQVELVQRQADDDEPKD